VAWRAAEIQGTEALLARSGRPRLTAAGLLHAAMVLGLVLWCALAVPLLMQAGKGGGAVSLTIAGRLVAAEQAHALFALDEGVLAVSDRAWSAQAAQLGHDGPIQPYLHAPLIAWLAVPLALLDAMQAKLALLALGFAATALTLLVAARSWAPDLTRPGGALALAAGVLLSWPLAAEVMDLTLEPIALLAAVIAIAAAQSGRSAIAGPALAAAAALTLTPAILVLYWIATRRFACVLWFLGASAALLAVGLCVAGPEAHLQWLARMQELAGVIVPSPYNGSLAGLLFGATYEGPRVTESGVALQTLPGWIGAVTLASGVVGAAWCLLDASKARRRPAADAAGQVALLLVALMTAPAAWAHSFLILAVAGVIWLRLSGATLPAVGLMILIAVAISQPIAIATALAISEGWRAWLTGSASFAALAMIALLLTARRRYFLAD
jgi:alpha-1,2-mannosyltransferase